MAVDVNALPLSKQITRRLAKPGVWIISPYSPDLASAKPHVVIGDKLAAVIDPTDTGFNVRKYVEEYVTDKPLIVLCTHSHGDHTNDNYMFDDVPIYMSEYAWGEIKARREMDDDAGWWVSHNTEGPKIKYEKGTYTPNILKVGDKIDLGGCEIEVLPYDGCHSPGSLIFLDKRDGILFTGDELECGQMLVMGRDGSTNSVEKLRDNIVRILEGWGDQFDMLCPPHNGTPIHAEFLKYLIENCERIMSGIEGSTEIGSTTYLLNPAANNARRSMNINPNARRSEWKGSSIVYRTDRIFRSQVEK